jgi:hypothetical protein
MLELSEPFKEDTFDNDSAYKSDSSSNPNAALRCICRFYRRKYRRTRIVLECWFTISAKLVARDTILPTSILAD